MTTFKLNGEAVSFDGDEDMPLLFFLREHAGLKGSKYGCGIGSCGACTIHVDGLAVRSCSFLMGGLLGGESITTIEGLSDGETLHPVQQAWLEEDVAQCGYCQAGQIMSVAALLEEIPTPTDEEIDTYHTNLCRCGSYYRMRKAIHKAAKLMQKSEDA